MPKQPQSSSPLGHYRQILITPERRQATTVARWPIIEDTMERLRSSAKRKSKHHLLFIGPRGIGKSHVLSLIEDGIANDSALAQSYLVARFPEESHRTLSFADFLLGLCDILRDQVPDELEWGQLYLSLHTEEDDNRIVDTLVPAIRRANQNRKRTLLVMLENLDEVFTRQIKDKRSVAAFRKFFTDANGCLLVSTSPLHFSAITSVDEPFYDFFDIQLLEHLTEEEAIELIRLNLEWEKGDREKTLLADFDSMRPKLLALYRMTAGNPRLTVMLYELIVNDSVTEVRQQLEILLDRITPFYQDRLKDLPPQERALLETMARMRDTSKTPASITARMRLKPNQTSMLLKRLTDAHYLRAHPHPADKRSRLYTIREGFFDIWLAMNVSRTARKRLPFLLDFFAAFYPSIEERNRKRAELHRKCDADALGSLDYLSDVGDPSERREAKIQLARRYSTLGNKDDAAAYLSETYMLESDGPSTDYLAEVEEMIRCWDLHRNGELEAFATKLEEISDSLSYKSWSETKIVFLRGQLEELDDLEHKTRVCLSLASHLRNQARWQEAEALLSFALKEVPDLGSSHLYSRILNDLALLLKDTNRFEEAEPLMRRALSIEESNHGPDHPNVGVRLNNLAMLLTDTNRIEEAEPLMRRALSIEESNHGPDHPRVGISLNSLATLFMHTDRFEEAEPLMRRALSIEESSYDPGHPWVGTSLNNLALLLIETDRLEEAEPLIRRALSIYESSYGPDHPWVGTSLNNLALLLVDTDRPDEAESLMRRALSIEESSYGPDHPAVGTSLNNLALLLKDTNRFKEAESLMRRALSINESSYGPDHPFVGRHLNNLAVLLEDTNRLGEAESNLLRAIEVLARSDKILRHSYFLPAVKDYLSLATKLDIDRSEAFARLSRATGKPVVALETLLED